MSEGSSWRSEGALASKPNNAVEEQGKRGVTTWSRQGGSRRSYLGDIRKGVIKQLVTLGIDC